LTGLEPICRAAGLLSSAKDVGADGLTALTDRPYRDLAYAVIRTAVQNTSM
jgi:hypothetical protein